MLNNATNAQELINELASRLKPLVNETESSFATTQNHYGDYMLTIQQLSKGNKNMAKAIALALIQAGANKHGVISAMQLI